MEKIHILYFKDINSVNEKNKGKKIIDRSYFSNRRIFVTDAGSFTELKDATYNGPFSNLCCIIGNNETEVLAFYMSVIHQVPLTNDLTTLFFDNGILNPFTDQDVKIYDRQNGKAKTKRKR